MRPSALRWLLAAGAAAGLAACTMQAPRVLRRLDVFRVDRVEVLGTRHLPPHVALAVSGISPAASVFDDPALWREPLLRHPLVAAVGVDRRLPNAVVLTIHEVEPVALAVTPELVAVDVHGTVLPIDPGGGSLDLPILQLESGVGGDGRLENPVALAALSAYDRIRRLDPTLATRVSEIRPLGDAFRLRLRTPAGAEALVPANAGPLQLRQLEVALADLSARGELERLRRVDVRFRDQVVVSLKPGRTG